MSETSVIINSLDRLDKVDADALQADVYNYVAEALGGILGQAEGCLSPFSATFSSGGGHYYATLSACSFAVKHPDLTRLGETTLSSMTATWKAHVVNFDPALESGEVTEYTGARTAALVAFAAYGANANTDRVGRAVSGYNGWNRFQNDLALPLLWARLVATPEGADTRRRWDAGLVDETPYVANRRLTQRVEFVWSALQPAAGAGNPWTAIAAIVGWRGAGAITTPVIRPIYAWDNPKHYTEPVGDFSSTEDYREDSNRLGQNGTLAPLSRNTVDGLIPDASDLGLVRQLYLLRRVVDAIKFAGASETVVAPGGPAWFDPPDRSLAGLASDISASTAMAPAVIINATRNEAAAQYNVFMRIGATTYTYTKADASPSGHILHLDTADFVAGFSPTQINTFLACIRAQVTAWWKGDYPPVSPFPVGFVVMGQPFVGRSAGGLWKAEMVFRDYTTNDIKYLAPTGWDSAAIATVNDEYTISMMLW